jgi:hypothetical protein
VIRPGTIRGLHIVSQGRLELGSLTRRFEAASGRDSGEVCPASGAGQSPASRAASFASQFLSLMRYCKDVAFAGVWCKSSPPKGGL